MSEIIKVASAGTMESSDAYVEISPAADVQVEIDSVVKGQVGDVIEEVVRDVLSSCDVTAAKVSVVDRGALECVLRARVETAVCRGKGDA